MTEHIDTGESIIRFTKLLEEINIKDYDIATVSVYYGEYIESLIKKLGKRLKIGKRGMIGADAFYALPHQSGVFVDNKMPHLPHPRKVSQRGYAGDSEHAKYYVPKARRTINKLANELVKLVE